MDEYGWKNGGLLYIREKVDGGGEYVLPMEILKPGADYTRAVHCGVIASCKEVGSNAVIVRTSQRTDGPGMVDVMPTRLVPLSIFFSARRIAKVVEEVRRGCFDSKLVAYSQVEGLGYNPEEVTVSITPFLDEPDVYDEYDENRRFCKAGLVTEHPNQDKVLLADMFELRKHSLVGDRHCSTNFLNNRTPIDSRLDVNRDFREFLKLQQFVRDADILDENMSYQFEGGMDRKRQRARLLQIREFAPKRKADFRLTPSLRSNSVGRRVFGITPKDGIEVSIAFVSNRKSFYEEVLPNISSNQKFVLALYKTSGPLQPNEIPDPRMVGYMACDRVHLTHQGTRPVQAALRKEDGIANLGSPELFPNLFFVMGGPLRKFHVTSDGYTQQFEQI